MTLARLSKPTVPSGRVAWPWHPLALGGPSAAIQFPARGGAAVQVQWGRLAKESGHDLRLREGIPEIEVYPPAVLTISPVPSSCGVNWVRGEGASPVLLALLQLVTPQLASGAG